MGESPNFVFPQRGLPDSTKHSPHPSSSLSSERDKTSDTFLSNNAVRPRLAVRTRSREGQRVSGYTSSVPEVSWTQRPQPQGICSTPPDSPIRARAYTMGADNTTTNNSNMDKAPFEATPLSPPLTPTQAKHKSSNSDVSLKTPTKPHTHLSPQPEDTGTTVFPYWTTDYEIVTTGPKAIKKVLGSGVWSDVYHALPTPPSPSSSLLSSSKESETTSRPPTPPSSSSSTSQHLPSAYAIKSPSSQSARSVLAHEAHILSYLTRFPTSSSFIVPFYGHDPRSDALVLKLIGGGTLESWIETSLNALPEPERAVALAKQFPGLATQLLSALEWLRSVGCVHGDVKPGNILVDAPSPPTSSSPSFLLTDFSSSTLTSLPTSTSSPAPPLGGGTWDFLSPSLLALPSSSSSHTASHDDDLWATALTLLITVVGISPFAFVGRNVFQRRECVRKGDPVGFVGFGDFGGRGVGRLRALGAALSEAQGKKVDIIQWFRRVLVRDDEKRVRGAGVWLEALVGC
ncbi:unnamed protein product [Periconia digitata]|uniref:Protein kinase domain-containing protein n=1 Tax=Periconia digitata TaxID=1303443 RepID=A0A9W4UXC9_9PLEO|nr:unnamed protein product [Periconia digitata]